LEGKGRRFEHLALFSVKESPAQFGRVDGTGIGAFLLAIVG
jgi:hypothetical protein